MSNRELSELFIRWYDGKVTNEAAAAALGCRKDSLSVCRRMAAILKTGLQGGDVSISSTLFRPVLTPIRGGGAGA